MSTSLNQRSRLEQLRTKHKMIRDKSIQQMEETKQFLIELDSGIYFDAIQLQPLSQYNQNIIEENQHLKAQLDQLTKNKTSISSSSTKHIQESETYQVLKEENTRLQNQLAQVTQDRDRIKLQYDEVVDSLTTKANQKQKRMEEEIQRLTQQVQTLQEAAQKTQSGSQQQQQQQQEYHEWVDKWKATNEMDPSTTKDMIKTLEVRDPDFQKIINLQALQSNKNDIIISDQQQQQDQSDDSRSSNSSSVLSDNIMQVEEDLQSLREEMERSDSQELKSILSNQIEQKDLQLQELEQQWRQEQLSPTSNYDFAETKDTTTMEPKKGNGDESDGRGWFSSYFDTNQKVPLHPKSEDEEYLEDEELHPASNKQDLTTIFESSSSTSEDDSSSAAESREGNDKLATVEDLVAQTEHSMGSNYSEYASNSEIEHGSEHSDSLPMDIQSLVEESKIEILESNRNKAGELGQSLASIYESYKSMTDFESESFGSEAE